jgi:hypothetical protein
MKTKFKTKNTEKMSLFVRHDSASVTVISKEERLRNLNRTEKMSLPAFARFGMTRVGFLTPNLLRKRMRIGIFEMKSASFTVIPNPDFNCLSRINRVRNLWESPPEADE